MGKQNDTSAGDAAKVSANNQTQMLQQIQQLIAQQQSEFGGATAALGTELGGLAGGAGAGANSILTLLQSITQNPDLLQSLTGVNSRDQNTKSLGFFNNEMRDGLDPATKANANSQLGQNYEQSMNDMLAKLKPGQNASALQQQGQNDFLQKSVNLNNDLASQDQAIKSAGATAGSTLANGVNQQAFSNVGSTGQLSLSALQPLLQLLGISSGDITALSGNANAQGNQALQYSQQQQQVNKDNAGAFGSGLGTLLGAGASAFTGGAAGAGGIGAILKGL